jgi:hypothetical protein
LDEPTDDRSKTILELARNPRLAHATLFRHRHPNNTPEFHYEIIDDWHGPSPQILTMAFRGAAKSTLAEEAIIIKSCLRLFKNGIILGESESRATERLTSIKHEIETNPYIAELFGDLVGPVWQERKIVLGNGTVIQAFGRGQSLRGAKHLDQRPDLAFGDDMEDDECVATPEAREKFKQWFMKVVIPALAPEYLFRIAATPLDPQAWAMKLKASPDWLTKTYPIEYVDAEGKRQPTWPSRFPLKFIDNIKKSYQELGAAQEYMQEYMCEAIDPASRTFTNDLIKVEPTVRAWQATYAFFDPARSVKTTSAFTGKVVFSWMNNRLIVWDADGQLWKPDQIVNDIFAVADEYSPVEIGVEETGLNEFILQPLRHEQRRRGMAIPLRAYNAPKGKLDFIKGLQPFFKAGEVIFAKELPELKKELLAFPTGRIDALNALAYALKMRPGLPLYEDFSQNNIVEDIPRSREPWWLAVNATQTFTTAALCQVINGGLYVAADWVREGDAGSEFSDIVTAAGLEASDKIRVITGSVHFGTHDTVGLRASARRVPVELRRGGTEVDGREYIRQLLRATRKGRPALQVGAKARNTLNAFSGGYAREVDKRGVVSDFARENGYKVLMEGLEGFAAVLRRGAAEPDPNVRYERAADGRQYITARASG